MIDTTPIHEILKLISIIQSVNITKCISGTNPSYFIKIFISLNNSRCSKFNASTNISITLIPCVSFRFLKLSIIYVYFYVCLFYTCKP